MKDHNLNMKDAAEPSVARLFSALFLRKLATHYKYEIFHDLFRADLPNPFASLRSAGSLSIRFRMQTCDASQIKTPTEIRGGL